MAGRGTDIKLSKTVSQNGGLHIILTELNDSSRIDRQLYGRCARQGDPGSYQMIVSLDDEIFTTYYSKKILKFLNRLHFPLPQWLTKLIIKLPQKHIEAKHKNSRLSLLKNEQSKEVSMGFAGKE